MQSLVSVLVPVFNGQKYIREMLDSLRNQSYRPIQIIIGNDCSSDNSAAICREWAGRIDEKEQITVTYIETESNVGLSQNINKMVGYVRGDFIFLADQDDVWKKNKIELQVRYLQKHQNCILCLSDRSITDEHLNIKILSEYKENGFTITSMNFDEVTKHLCCYASNCMALRNTENIKKIFDIPKGIVMHDTYIAAASSCFGTVDFIYEPVLLYRIHSGNLSGNYSSYFAKSSLDAFIKNYHKWKRFKISTDNDTKIIIKTLEERFGMKITNPKSPYLQKQRIKSRLIWAIGMTIKEKRQHIIGRWE